MFKIGTSVRHKNSSAMGDGVIVGENRFGNVKVCWESDKVRVIEIGASWCVNGAGKTREGTKFTNWCRSESTQNLMVKN